MSNTIKEIRNNVKAFMKSKQYQSAIFWAELLLNQRKDSPSDLYIYAEVLFYNEEYRRVIDFTERHKLHNKYLTFRLLAARSYFEIKDFMNAIKVLDINISSEDSCMDSVSSFYIGNTSILDRIDPSEFILFGYSVEMLENNYYFLLGEIHEQLDLRNKAIQYYMLSLKSNVTCFAAVQKLSSGNSMSTDEARVFLSSLDFNSCGDKNLAQVLRASYEDHFGIEHTGVDDLKLSMADCSSSMLNTANRYYKTSQFTKAYDMTKKILNCDPHNINCITLHASVMTALKYTNELFVFATSMIDNYPDKKESWYASGCYYLVSNRLKIARTQFLKSVEIDKFFAYAWVALGHIYSLENERDQAILAYCSANEAMKGSHIPYLYIAVEYSMTNNYTMTINYIQEAMTDGSRDPYFWHERGFVTYNHKNYQESLKYFLTTYQRNRNMPSCNTVCWEPLFNNIGHCFYKLGKYEKSIEFFKLALGAKPNNPSTMISMALVYTRQGELSKALDTLNRVKILDSRNLPAECLMKTIAKLNTKKYLLSSTDNVSGKDDFKIPQMLLKDIPNEKVISKRSFESIQKIMNEDSLIMLKKNYLLDKY